LLSESLWENNLLHSGGYNNSKDNNKDKDLTSNKPNNKVQLLNNANYLMISAKQDVKFHKDSSILVTSVVDYEAIELVKSKENFSIF